MDSISRMRLTVRSSLPDTRSASQPLRCRLRFRLIVRCCLCVCVLIDAPQEFWDALPDYHKIPLPADPWAPVGMPIVAWHPYADVSGMVETPAFNGTVNMTRLHVYRKSYYASISYVSIYESHKFLCPLNAVYEFRFSPDQCASGRPWPD